MPRLHLKGLLLLRGVGRKRGGSRGPSVLQAATDNNFDDADAVVNTKSLSLWRRPRFCARSLILLRAFPCSSIRCFSGVFFASLVVPCKRNEAAVKMWVQRGDGETLKELGDGELHEAHASSSSSPQRICGRQQEDVRGSSHLTHEAKLSQRRSSKQASRTCIRRCHVAFQLGDIFRGTSLQHAALPAGRAHLLQELEVVANIGTRALPLVNGTELPPAVDVNAHTCKKIMHAMRSREMR